MPLAFDRVLARTRSEDNGSAEDRCFTAEEFLELPLHERIQLLVGSQLTFFRGTARIDPREALKSLRD